MDNIEETTTVFLEPSLNVSGDSPLGKLQLNDPITRDASLPVMNIIFSVALTGAISLLGSAANVINIVIFFRQQRFDNSVSISLLALAVSDLGSLLPLLWRSVALNPLFHLSDVDLDSHAVLYLTSGYPHAVFNRITCLITAFITFERCVCIALPMKVKDIITPKRTLISVVVMFLVLFAIISPVFATVQLAPSSQAELNKTQYSLLYASNGETVENMSFSTAVFIHLCSFIIVVVCTMILIHNLQVKSRWRRKATSVPSDSISLREKRVMKMVTMLASIFILCLLPSTVTVILMMLLSTEFGNNVLSFNSFLVAWEILNLLEAINSSVSILVYYNMSSKFRRGFNSILNVSKAAVKEVRFRAVYV